MKRLLVIFALMIMLAFTGKVMAIPEVTVSRTERPPVIDGKGEDPCWTGLEEYSGFHVLIPDPAKAPSEKTTFKICYDDKSIYFLIRCFDEPDEISIREGHRDMTEGDLVGVLLDTYNDDYTAYFLVVNAAGVQSDAHCEKDGIIQDETWDADWGSAVSIDNYGWVVEIAVPFRELRFNISEDMTWGFNVVRKICNNNEILSYTDLGPVQYLKISGSAVLKGLDNRIEHGRFNIKASGFSRFQSKFMEEGYELTGGMSLDVKTHISSGLVLDAALFPDFGELEADPNVINLSRYEYYYPERRALFVERNDFFDTPLSLFYSRRIGSKLPDGSFIPLIGGMKLTGKEGKWTIAALNTWTGATSFTNYYGEKETIPAATQSVVRVAADVAKSSSVGMIGTRFSDGENIETVAGTDASIDLGDEWRFTGQVAADMDGADHPAAGKVSIGKSSTYYSINLLYSDIGANFSANRLGYVPWKGRKSYSFSLNLIPRFDKGHIVFLNDNVWGRVSYYPWEPYKSMFMGKSILILTRGNWQSIALIYFFREYYNDYYSGFEGLFPGKVAEFYITSDQSKEVYFECAVKGGDFIEYWKDYFGAFLETDGSIHFQLLRNLSVDIEGTFMRKYFDHIDGDKDSDTFIPSCRFSYAVTKTLFLRMFAQGISLSEAGIGSDEWMNDIFHDMDVDFNMLLEKRFNAMQFLLGWNHSSNGEGDYTDYVGLKLIYSLKY